MSQTLFMIHGMWGTGAHWKDWRAFFEAEGFHCITPTLLYHDQPPGTPPNDALGTTSLEDYTDDLERQIAALEEPPVIIGHSMGGLLAQKLAARGLGGKTVLLHPAAPAGILALRWSVIRSFASCLTKWGFWKRPHLTRFAEISYSSLHLLSPEEQREVYSTLVPESGRAIFETGLWTMDRRRGSAVDASKIRTPMMVTTGTPDRIVPASVVRKVAARYPTLEEFREFPDQAHWVLSQPGWERVATSVRDWIRRD